MSLATATMSRVAAVTRANGGDLHRPMSRRTLAARCVCAHYKYTARHLPLCFNPGLNRAARSARLQITHNKSREECYFCFGASALNLSRPSHRYATHSAITYWDTSIVKRPLALIIHNALSAALLHVAWCGVPGLIESLVYLGVIALCSTAIHNTINIVLQIDRSTCLVLTKMYYRIVCRSVRTLSVGVGYCCVDHADGRRAAHRFISSLTCLRALAPPPAPHCFASPPRTPSRLHNSYCIARASLTNKLI